MARLALAAALAVLVAACGGARTETVTATVTEPGPTTTVEAEGEREEGAAAVAADLCTSLPVGEIAQFATGADPDDPEAVAASLAASVRPELREAAHEGCADALRRK